MYRPENRDPEKVNFYPIALHASPHHDERFIYGKRLDPSVISPVTEKGVARMYSNKVSYRSDFKLRSYEDFTTGMGTSYGLCRI